MSKDEQIFRLYKLLDDIDTLDDAAKENDATFRAKCYIIQKQRHLVVTGSQADKLYDRFYDPTNNLSGKERE